MGAVRGLVLARAILVHDLGLEVPVASLGLRVALAVVQGAVVRVT